MIWDARFADYGPSQEGLNRNIGVMARPFRWASFFYNRSTTFDLNIGRYDPFGNDIAGAGGKGRDYGIRLDLWNDRLTLRFNKYENTLGPQRASNQINTLRDPFFDVENRVRLLDPCIRTINVVDGNMRGYRVAGRPNYFIMSDSASDGYELELNFTPVRNWNIRLNGAKSESIESNIGKPWFEWGAQRLPVWESVVAKEFYVDAILGYRGKLKAFGASTTGCRSTCATSWTTTHRSRCKPGPRARSSSSPPSNRGRSCSRLR